MKDDKFMFLELMNQEPKIQVYKFSQIIWYSICAVVLLLSVYTGIVYAF